MNRAGGVGVYFLVTSFLKFCWLVKVNMQENGFRVSIVIFHT